MFDWQQFEKQHVWHPYAAMLPAAPVFAIEKADACLLHLTDGRILIDGMSSWWAAIHGYNNPTLNAAIQNQLPKMAHIMFGGLTHQNAAELAYLLVEVTPNDLEYVFFSDSGSVAVEVAIKMALQYWIGKKQHKKTRLLALRGGYHGDTFAAMSVCDPITGMHHLFAHSDLLATQVFAELEPNLDDFTKKITQHAHELAAVILEPIVQGAGGMRFYDAELLQQIRFLCDKHDVLLIDDEIATGFGRTGKLFACEHAAITPDIMCLGKALTGGYMTLAATLCTHQVCAGIHADVNNNGVLMHGPTFMANPLATAVACASIRLLLDSPWQQRVTNISKILEQELGQCRTWMQVFDVRVLGACGVVELHQPICNMTEIQQLFVEQGVWIRPFGRLVYLMPPFIITEYQLRFLCNGLRNVVATIC
ncbi:MAG: adenosylmethionine--8-amino-7-oxononanoate transaminase [Mariprofundales bacterium]